MSSRRGSTSAEYLGLIVVITAMLASMLVVRSYIADRRAPVQPLPALTRLLQVLDDAPPVRRPPSVTGGPRRHHPRPRRPRITIEIPPWAR